MTRPEVGKQYRVIKPGAALSWWEPCGPYCQESKRVTLNVDDVITYTRQTHGGGSDDVDYNYFTKDKSCGAFWPNNWGMCDMSFLEPVSAT